MPEYPVSRQRFRNICVRIDQNEQDFEPECYVENAATFSNLSKEEFIFGLQGFTDLSSSGERDQGRVCSR